MFQVNDYVVYGNNGVCRILEIGTPEIRGVENSKIYYTLQPVYSRGSIIYIPLDNEKPIVRGVITKEEALRLIQDVPNIEIIEGANDKFREMKYKEAMKKYDCREWIRIIKTFYQNNRHRLTEGKKISSIDMRYLHDAQEYLYGELSISLGIPKEEMEDFILKNLAL
jgi:CarD family transcriptional regulator